MSCKLKKIQSYSENKMKQQGKINKMENIIKKIPLLKRKEMSGADFSNVNDYLCMKYDCMHPSVYMPHYVRDVFAQSRLDSDFM